MSVAHTEHFECMCHTHMLIADVASIEDVADGDGWIELAWWQQGKGRSPWSYRLRHVWRILRTGDPYSDFLPLDSETATRLRDWLSRAIEQVTPQEQPPR